MRAVFMGTPEIAAEILKTVLASEHEVAAVVTQTDKPKGRGQKNTYPPVKEVALEHGIPVLQPEKAKSPEFLAEMERLQPDIILVAAYGKLLPKELLTLPKFGCINVHASLLPKYRGASPIQWAVINGEKVSGVTIMHMEEGLDTGDIILSKEIPLSEEETAGSLHDKLAELGGPALLEAMALLAAGNAPRIPQKEEEATYVKVLDKSFGNLDFNCPAVQLERLVRGLNPWPTAYTYLDGKLLKIWKAGILPGCGMAGNRAAKAETDAAGLSAEDNRNGKNVPAGLSAEDNRNGENVPAGLSVEDNPYGRTVPGMVVSVQKDGFGIATGDGVLYVKEVQLEGKRRMTAEEFLRGYGVKTGILLGLDRKTDNG